MIDDQKYDELPEDPELAFVYLDKQFRETLDAKLERSENNDAISFFYSEYMNHVIAAATALELGILANWTVPTRQSDVFAAYRSFSTEVSNYLVQIKVRHGRRRRTFSVTLDSIEKQKIRHHLEQIRRLIDESNLSTDKKEAIFKRINGLEIEIDRDRTRLEAFADLAGGLAQISGDFARDGAEPWWKWAKPIFEILGAAKEKEDQLPQLPSPREHKRLEAPRVQNPSPQSNDADLDDEIPF